MSIHTHATSTDAPRETPPTIIVIFGASGDLTARKLAPAIFNLSKDDLLPESCYLIGYGRSSMSDEAFRDYLQESLASHSRRPIEDDAWNALAPNISFHAGGYDDFDDEVQQQQGAQEDIDLDTICGHTKACSYGSETGVKRLGLRIIISEIKI